MKTIDARQEPTAYNIACELSGVTCFGPATVADMIHKLHDITITLHKDAVCQRLEHALPTYAIADHASITHGGITLAATTASAVRDAVVALINRRSDH